MRAAKAKVDFDVTQYERAHGKRPRGFGSWAFKVEGVKELLWVHQAHYGDAKERVVAEVAKLYPDIPEHRYVLVTVQS